jgi:hypothetical protein
MMREDSTGGTVGYVSSSKSPATIEKSHLQEPRWFDTLSIGVECDTVMEGLEDYENLVKALPRAVLAMYLCLLAYT